MFEAMSTMMVHNSCLNVSVIIISFLSHSLNIEYITNIVGVMTLTRWFEVIK